MIKIPARKSLIKVCAPKPKATPATPALANNGATLKPTTLNADIIATVQIINAEALLNSCPTALTLCTVRCCITMADNSAVLSASLLY